MFKIWMLIGSIVLHASLLNAMGSQGLLPNLKSNMKRSPIRVQLDMLRANGDFLADLETIEQLLNDGAGDLKGHIASLRRPDFIKVLGSYRRFMNATNRIDTENIDRAAWHLMKTVRMEYFNNLENIFGTQMIARSITMDQGEVAQVVKPKRRPFEEMGNVRRIGALF